MRAFLTQLSIQFKTDLRERTTLIQYYIVPLMFFFIFGGVLHSISPNSKQTLITAMTAFAITMGSVQGVSASVAALKSSGSLRAYNVCGIPPVSVLLSQMISAFLHLIIVSAAVICLSPLLFKASLPANLAMYIMVLVLFILASISVGLLIGAAAKPQHSAIIAIAVFILSVMLGGMMFPASMLPKALVYAGRALPVTYAVQALGSLGYSIKADFTAVQGIIVLAGMSAAALAASVIVLAAKGRESA